MALAQAQAPDQVAGVRYRPGTPGYDARRTGFNLAIEHRPHVIVDARTPGDVVAAVRQAAGEGRPVAVMNTGHGPSVAADGAVLIRTGGLRGVAVDPVRRTARVAGGEVWRDVIAAAAPHGLAPLNGSSPAVGVVGYTLGGGIGLLSRRFGFAADHVRWIELVTADGRLRRVSADPAAGGDPDLFWALRGAGANFGVVTALEVDLFPVARLLGGELCFGDEVGADVVPAYVDWARAVPEAMASSLMLMRYPDDPAVRPELRGRHVTHVRLAWSGEGRGAGRGDGDDLAAGRPWVERLRGIGPRLVDTVRTMPYTEVGTIHHEPVDEPVPAFDRNVLLGDLDGAAASALWRHAGPGAAAPLLAELRAWGGALSRPPAVPNAVGGRDARFSLLGIAGPDPADRARRDEMLDALAPWGTGGTYLNFCGVEDGVGDPAAGAVQRAHRPGDLARLRTLKAIHDPGNVFRVNFNVAPSTRTGG
jgi:FAD/FMN-containing dehydrogenase